MFAKRLARAGMVCSLLLGVLVLAPAPQAAAAPEVPKAPDQVSGSWCGQAGVESSYSPVTPTVVVNKQTLTPATWYSKKLTGLAGVPSDARAVVLNVLVNAPEAMALYMGSSPVNGQ